MKKGIIVILVIFALGGLMFFMNAPCNCGKTHDSSDATDSGLSTISPLEAKEVSRNNPKIASPQKKYIVYYFHGNFRCPSCKKIESYTDETVHLKFARQLKNGLILWRVVNTDEPANKHFLKDYQLFTKSVVVVEIKNGKQSRWKNLDKVWEYLGDKSKFSLYIENEIKQFIGGT